MPPPEAEQLKQGPLAVLPLMVLLLIISTPLLAIPPPWALAVSTVFPLTVLSLIASVPLLEMPPPPFRIVNLESVTWALGLEIVTTLPAPPPQMIVVLAPEPINFKLKPMKRFST